MNAAIGLCAFCEIHGPKVILTTETQRDFENHSSKLKFYGSKSALKQYKNSQTQQRCKGCSSLGDLKYLSNDNETRTSFLSAQQPLLQDVGKLLNYACIRSLSCEIHSGKEGVCYFGDENRGHVLSHTFILKDVQARGFRKWCSFIVLMRDKQFLLNMWSFLITNLREVIRELQNYADKKFKMENSECSQRAARIAMMSNEQGSGLNLHKQSSSLTEITDEKHIFIRIHMWLTWILSAGGRHFVEKLPRSLLNDEDIIKSNNCKEIVKRKIMDFENQKLLCLTVFSEVCEKCPVSVLRALKKTLGKEQFRQILYATLTGVQILIRGSRLQTLESLYSFYFLVPATCRKVIAMAVEYVDKSLCNFIGVDNTVAVPLPCEDVCRLDIVSTKGKRKNFKTYFIRWMGKLPAKLPTLLIKIEKSLDNEKFADSVLKLHLSVLQEEWVSIAKMVCALKVQDADKINLIKSLGGGPQDEKLLNAWSQNLCQNLV